MDQRELLGADRPPDRLALGIVERRIVPLVDPGRFDVRGRLDADDDVTQFGERAVGSREFLEGVEHPLEGDVVDVEVRAQVPAEDEARRLAVERDGDRVVRHPATVPVGLSSRWGSRFESITRSPTPISVSGSSSPLRWRTNFTR